MEGEGRPSRHLSWLSVKLDIHFNLPLPTKSELGLREAGEYIEITEAAGHFMVRLRVVPIGITSFQPHWQADLAVLEGRQAGSEVYSTCHILGTGAWEAIGQNQQ